MPAHLEYAVAALKPDVGVLVLIVFELRKHGGFSGCRDAARVQRAGWIPA
jgi:hypothetical protein